MEVDGQMEGTEEGGATAAQAEEEEEQEEEEQQQQAAVAGIAPFEAYMPSQCTSVSPVNWKRLRWMGSWISRPSTVEFTTRLFQYH
jgi:hypothetical protein